MTEDGEKPTRLKKEGFESVCGVDEVSETMPRSVEVGGRDVLVCRHDGEILAVDAICPHRNQSMERARLDDGEIICPHHRYRFDLRTGRSNRRCAPVETYEVAVVDDEVWIRSRR